jgi:type I restriction enzyme, S subunit
MKTNLLQKNIPKGWQIKKIKDLLDFEQPTKYIVESSSYTPTGKTAVLTANKSFVLGYTNETGGVYIDTPVIIFDDFTTDSKYVDFPFKIKSSAIKILTNRDENTDLKFVYEIMKSFTFPIANHKRHYISQYQELDIVIPTIKEQEKIADILSAVDKEIQKVE